MSYWADHHIVLVGTVGFVIVAVAVTALLRRWWKWLLLVPPIVGVFFWNAWDRSALSAVYSTWIVIFLYVGLGIGIALMGVRGRWA